MLECVCCEVVAAEEVCVWEARDEERKGVDGLALNFGHQAEQSIYFHNLSAMCFRF